MMLHAQLHAVTQRHCLSQANIYRTCTGFDFTVGISLLRLHANRISRTPSPTESMLDRMNAVLADGADEALREPWTMKIALVSSKS